MFEKLAFVFGPFSLRSPQASIIFVTIRLRIIVPGSLPSTRLTALRTSWNHVHVGLKRVLSQLLNADDNLFSNGFIERGFNGLGHFHCGQRVDKTAPGQSVFAKKARF